MRVGAALKAVSIVAGASVLMPYLLLSVHGRQQPRPALLVFRAVEEVERVQPVGNQAVQLHADEIRMLVLALPTGRDAHRRLSAAISVWLSWHSLKLASRPSIRASERRSG